MLDNNGKYTKLTLDEALGMALADAADAGITVESGSVEEQIAGYFAQFLETYDTAFFKSYQLQFNPVGSDIDLQNPNTPRLQAAVASGYLLLSNATGAPIEVTINSIFTAPNGNTYTTGNNSVIVPAGGTATIAVYSETTGKAQNLPSGQEFTGSYDLTAENPLPFTNGRDLETDTEYLNRIVWLKTNNTSQQATAAAKKELQDFYQAAEIYVNNTSNSLSDPIPVPSNGYVCVVQFPSGPEASAAEIAKALQIVANRLEFGNANNNSTELHPVLGGTVFSGPFPQNYYISAAQNVDALLTATLTVKFPANIDENEKNTFATAFAQFFAQNVVNFFGGAAGNASCTFQAAGSPVPDPITTDLPVQAAAGIIGPLAPSFSIEQIRALISDEADLVQLPNIEYKSCDALSLIFDSGEYGENPVELNIDAPAGGTVAAIDFKFDSLFSDYTSWYDRYVFFDPANILITVNEET